jgi:hypothetical protein
MFRKLAVSLAVAAGLIIHLAVPASATLGVGGFALRDSLVESSPVKTAQFVVAADADYLKAKVEAGKQKIEAKRAENYAEVMEGRATGAIDYDLSRRTSKIGRSRRHPRAS